MFWFDQPASPVHELAVTPVFSRAVVVGCQEHCGDVWKAKMPLPRAPHLAEREELDAAIQAGTEVAIRSFLERHPESRYRDEAQAALNKMIDRAKQP